MDCGGVRGRVKGVGGGCRSEVWGVLSLVLLFGGLGLFLGFVVSLDAGFVVVDIVDGAREGVEGDCDWA